jgi:hypothetical protein
MEGDISKDVAVPTISGNLNLSALVLHFRIVDQLPNGPQLSEKNIHLTLTSGEAMRLLSMLQAVQEKMRLSPDLQPVVTIAIPPEKDRH